MTVTTQSPLNEDTPVVAELVERLFGPHVCHVGTLSMRTVRVGRKRTQTSAGRSVTVVGESLQYWFGYRETRFGYYPAIWVTSVDPVTGERTQLKRPWWPLTPLRPFSRYAFTTRYQLKLLYRQLDRRP